MAFSLNVIIILLYVKFFRNHRLKIDSNEIRRLNEQCEMYKIEAEKWKIDVEHYKQENIRLQNAYDELKKAHAICKERQGETIIEYSSPQPIEKSPDAPLIPFDPENPFFECCGVEISLRGTEYPDSETICHPLPQHLKHYENLRQEGIDCDKKIRIGDEIMNVHKALLIERIPHFKVLFAGIWAESSTEIINLSTQFCQFDLKSMQHLLEYAYTGIITITQNTAQYLMCAAAYFEMESILDECYAFMRKRIQYDDIFPLLVFCRNINYKKYSFGSFIKANFVPLSLTSNFLELSVGTIEDLLKSNSLNVDNEKQVFDAVDRWIGKDVERNKYGARLLKLIRTPRLSSSFLTEIVETKKWIYENPECIDIMNEARGIGKNSNIHLNNLERNCGYAHNLIIMTNGNRQEEIEKNDKSIIYIFDPMTNKWNTGLIESRKLYGRTAVIGEKIYFIGNPYGCPDDEDDDLSGAIITYDTQNNHFHEMRVPNQLLLNDESIGVIDGKIYRTGGKWHNENRVLSVFDPLNANEGWKRLTDMERGRRSAACCVANGKLYILGGCEGGEELKDGECYDPATNKWSAIPPLNTMAIYCGITSLNGDIYIAGGRFGWGEDRFLKDLFKFSPDNGRWEKLKEMNFPRFKPTLIASCGFLFVIGGRTPYKEERTIERYNPIENEWSVVTEMKRFSNNISDIIISFPIPASFPSPNMEVLVNFTFSKDSQDRTDSTIANRFDI